MNQIQLSSVVQNLQRYLNQRLVPLRLEALELVRVRQRDSEHASPLNLASCQIKYDMAGHAPCCMVSAQAWRVRADISTESGYFIAFLGL